MNAIAMNPFAIVGVQQSTVTNNNKNSEFKELTLVGNVFPGLTAAQDAYIDVYLNYKLPKYRRRIMTKGGTGEAVRIVQIEQADTYIIESLNFNGYLLGEFGNNPNSLINATLFGSANIAVPNVKALNILTPFDYTAGVSADGMRTFGAVTGNLCLLLVDIAGNALATPASIVLEQSDDETGTNTETVPVTISPDNPPGVNSFASITSAAEGCFWGSFQRTKVCLMATLTVPAASTCRMSVTAIELPR